MEIPKFRIAFTLESVTIEGGAKGPYYCKARVNCTTHKEQAWVYGWEDALDVAKVWLSNAPIVSLTFERIDTK